MVRSYTKHLCALCGQLISIAGCAKSRHMRKHVANGEADEIVWQKIERWRNSDGTLSETPIDRDFEFVPGTGKTIERRKYVRRRSK